jgi:hypothetical protein
MMSRYIVGIEPRGLGDEQLVRGHWLPSLQTLAGLAATRRLEKVISLQDKQVFSLPSGRMQAIHRILKVTKLVFRVFGGGLMYVLWHGLKVEVKLAFTIQSLATPHWHLTFNRF